MLINTGLLASKNNVIHEMSWIYGWIWTNYSWPMAVFSTFIFLNCHSFLLLKAPIWWHVPLALNWHSLFVRRNRVGKNMANVGCPKFAGSRLIFFSFHIPCAVYLKIIVLAGCICIFASGTNIWLNHPPPPFWQGFDHHLNHWNHNTLSCPIVM